MVARQHLSKDRHKVCLEAAWELDAIALMLPDLVSCETVEELQSLFRVRCVAARVRELANALMSGIDDSAVELSGINGLNQRVLLCDPAPCQT